jgi:alginate O-acetyltransferase complex protein AlgJ
MLESSNRERPGADRRRHWCALILASALLLAGADAAHFVKLPAGGLGENRTLARAPKFPTTISDLHTFSQSVDDYVRDNFPLRAHIISSMNYLRYLAGYSTTKIILVGRDGWLFYDNGTHLAYGLGKTRLPADALDRWLEGLQKNTDYTKARGIGFYVLPAPQQESIYQELVPTWLAPGTQKFIESDQIIGAAAQKGFDNIVDVRGLLLAAKARKIYWRYDTHWTGDGAYIAYQTLMTRISRDFPDLAPLPQSNFTPLPNNMIPYGISYPLGIRNFIEESGITYFNSRLSVGKKITYLGERTDFNAAQIWETNPDAKRTLLFIRDSFGTELLPLLSPHFRRIILVHLQDGFFRKDLIERYQPDVVILEVIENGLRHVM